jgi:glyceraldehyde 3-phosphate dehydrogenase
MARVAINGLGRIGRAALKQLMEIPGLELVAVNDLIPLDNLAYLLKFDTVYGRYEKTVETQEGKMIVGGVEIQFLSERNPEELPWEDLDVDLVFECTGVFRKREDLEKHLKAGAEHVILSAPAKDELLTVVHGVNSPEKEDALMISCASCTTNCITPVVEVMDRRLGVKKATLTTIHAYTSSQQIVDGPASKWRRGRAGAANFVPTTTGAALATAKALPQIEGRFDGVAVRGPIPVGSISDIVFLVEKGTSVDEVNSIFREESQSDRYQGIMGVSDDHLVSSDIIKDPRASIVDLTMTKVIDGDLVKIMSWYDNEWGYTAQMMREAQRLLS